MVQPATTGTDRIYQYVIPEGIEYGYSYDYSHPLDDSLVGNIAQSRGERSQ